MRRGLSIAVAVVSATALIGLGTGCGSSDSADITPAGATTIENVAAQTDSQGKTVSAPPVDPGAGGGATPPDSGGANAAAGKVVFEANCQGCHPSAGTEAGIGPALNSTTLDAVGIRNQVVNGGGAMPGGLVSGTDLDNVVAYVESIQ